MVKLKDFKMPRSCSECEFMGWFNAEDKDKTVFGCVLTPTPNDRTHDPRYGVRLIKNIWKRPKWCRLKKSLF